jgi:hypothetical protein
MGKIIAMTAVGLVTLGLTATSITNAYADDGDATVTISGHMTFDAGVVPEVELWDSGFDELDDATPDAAGNYSFDVTDDGPGSYAVSFSDLRDDGADVTQFYPNYLTDDPSDPGITYFAVGATSVAGIDGNVTVVPFSATPSPVMSGSTAVGASLSVDADEDDWNESPDYSYQWYRSGVAISGASDDNYTTTSADIDKKISVTELATEDGYASVSLDSNAITVHPGTLVSKTPTIVGVHKVGRTLRAETGKWSPTPTFTYRWYANGKAIKKATKSTYKPTASVAGKKISVRVTGAHGGYLKAVRTSSLTKAVHF